MAQVNVNSAGGLDAPRDLLTVSTDKLDYAPGQTAVITTTVGIGYTVEIQVSHVDGSGADRQYGTADDVLDAARNGASRDHDAVRVTDGGAGDTDGIANGSITYRWFVNPDDSLGERFRVSVKEVEGGGAGAVGYATFTDALPAPIQTFYVPLPQEDLFDSLGTISNDADGYVQSAIGIAVAAPGTIIYYDHWEDGYESNVTAPTQSTTEIWGDGNILNGAAPGVVNNAGDVFAGGDVAVLINAIPADPRDPSDIFYDGGDRIQASFPIAVTTGSFAEEPGSYLAGAVEVLDTDSWSTHYTMPVGEDTDSDTDAFQYTAVYIMAGSDNTSVTIDHVTGPDETRVLDQGENWVVRVDAGDTVSSTKAVQADLVTGDINSNYEMRWYSLTPTDSWSDEYYAPVAEEEGPTGFWFFNPGNTAITIHYDSQEADGQGNFVVAAGANRFVEVGDEIELDDVEASGLRFYSEDDAVFFALSQIDSSGDGQTTEWGTRLISPGELSSQVLVGLGIGNSKNSPSIPIKDIVWVTPVADAIINVDFDGDGVVDETISAERLESITIGDDDDHDMSGATIFAVDSNGNPVDIAAAWGQDPRLVSGGDPDALDLGTIIPPLPGLTAAKSASLFDDVDGDGKFDPGDTIQYTVTVLNFTRVAIPAAGYNIIDDASPMFDNADYVSGSTFFTDATSAGPDGLFGTTDDVTLTVQISDNGTGTPFPLDDAPSSGFNSTQILSGYERHTYTFRATIKDFADLAPGTTDIVNTGDLRVNDESIKDLNATVTLDFEAGIQIVKSTNGFDVIDLLAPGDAVVWTYNVTNTGNVLLANIVVTDDAGTPDDDGDDFDPAYVSGDTNSDGILDFDETWLYQETGPNAVAGFYRNVATVSGDPVYGDGATPVDDLDSPTDTDASHYFAGTPPTLSYEMDKTVLDVAGRGANGAVLAAGEVITYQITITNQNGDLPIPGLTLTDALLQGPDATLTGPVQTGGNAGNQLLEVGETWTYTGTYTVQQADLDSRGTLEPDNVVSGLIDNTATVSTPLSEDDLSDSAHVPLAYTPGYTIDKTVLDVAGQGPGGTVVLAGTITYQIVVANTGNITLTGVTVDDPLLDGPNGTLASPDESLNSDGRLEVGETWTYTGTYSVQQIDLQTRGDSADGGSALDGDIDNTATVSSNELPDRSDSAVVPLTYDPDMEVVKTVVDVGGKGPDGAIDNPGEVIIYEIVATNTGNFDLTGVENDDPLLEGPNGTVGDPVESMNADGVLEVGETWTYIGTYTVTEAEYYAISWKNGFENCFIENVATVDTDQGSRTSNHTKTPLFSGEIICGTIGKDVIQSGSPGDLEPTESRDYIVVARGNDVIDALGGNDYIEGGRGKDKLTGGSGKDSFVFTVPVKNKNADKILDFEHGQDKIVLDSAVFKKLDPGHLGDTFFANGYARDKNDFIVFDKSEGTLSYDPNGKKGGDGTVFATVKGDAVDADSIFVI